MSAEPEISDEEVVELMANRGRRVIEAVACDEDGAPIRLANHHAPCGTLLWVGWHDCNGLRWLARYYAEPEDARAVVQCPVCEGELSRLTMLTGLEMDRRIDAALETDAMDGGTIAAITALCDRGQTFEEVAALFARSGDELRAEISAWCANQPVST